MAGFPASEALEVLKITEGNILSQWACAGREVFEPYTIWLAEVRRVIHVLEASDAGEPVAYRWMWPETNQWHYADYNLHPECETVEPLYNTLSFSKHLDTAPDLCV